MNSAGRQQVLLWTAIAGLGALAAVIVVVQLTGQRDPSPASLADNPRREIPGELLYEDAEGCILRIPASGGTGERVYCGQPAGLTGPTSFAWLDANTVAFFTSQPLSNPAKVVEFNLETKEETVTQRTVNLIAGAGAIEPLSAKGDRAAISANVLVVTRDGNRQVVATLDLEGYSARPILWSPDGEWIVVMANEQREYENMELWIFSKDGTVSGTLVGGLTRGVLSWRIDGIGVSPVVVE